MIQPSRLRWRLLLVSAVALAAMALVRVAFPHTETRLLALVYLGLVAAAHALLPRARWSWVTLTIVAASGLTGLVAARWHLAGLCPGLHQPHCMPRTRHIVGWHWAG